LTLSPLGQGLASTFCGKCHLGVVSAGSAGGPPEKEQLWQSLKGAGELPKQWSGPSPVYSPLVVGCPDPQKASCAKRVVDWYGSKGIHISPPNVHFFDDHTGNTNGFAQLGYNARQISCASRDWSIGGTVGFCGAALSEIVPDKGVFNCKS